MERREALKALAILTGGAVLVPSCNFMKEDILAAYQNLEVTASLQKLLASIADTIIPAGTSKGATDVNVQDFILVMVNDCMNADDQKVFTQGLNGFKEYSKKAGGKRFDKMNPEEKLTLVAAAIALVQEPFQLVDGEDEDDRVERENEYAVPAFLKITKRYTIQGFMVSQYIQTEVIPYKIIPGPYQGAVLLTDIAKETIHG